MVSSCLQKEVPVVVWPADLLDRFQEYQTRYNQSPEPVVSDQTAPLLKRVDDKTVISASYQGVPAGYESEPERTSSENGESSA